MSIYINVVNQKLIVSSSLDNIVSGSQRFVRFRFNLGDEWNDLSTFAQFTQNDVAYNQYLDSDNSVFLPSEIGSGTCTLALYGSNESVIATTNNLLLTIGENIIISDANSTEISNSLYNQLITRINSITSFGTSLVAVTSQDDMELQYATMPYFLYIGTTTEDYINGHIYQIVRSGDEGSYSYTSEDLSVVYDSSNYEQTSNKITDFLQRDNLTDDQYPTAKSVYDALYEMSSQITAGIENLIQTIKTTPNLSEIWEYTSYFLYTGETQNGYINGHLYEIIRVQGENYPEYSVVDLTPGLSAGGGGSVDISGCEQKSNKVTALTSESTNTQYPSAKAVYDELANKVTAETGKGLSTNDFTSEEKAKLRELNSTLYASASETILALDGKANQNEVEAALAIKANSADVLAALNNKAESNHTHSAEDVQGLNWATSTQSNITTLSPEDKTEYTLTAIDTLAITVVNTVQCKIDVTFGSTPALTISPLSYAIEGDSITDIVAGDRVIILLDKGVCYINILEAA